MQVLRHKEPLHRQNLFFLRRAVGLKQRIYPLNRNGNKATKSQTAPKQRGEIKPTQQKNNIATEKQLNTQNKTTKSHTRKKARRCVLFLIIFKNQTLYLRIALRFHTNLFHRQDSQTTQDALLQVP